MNRAACYHHVSVGWFHPLLGSCLCISASCCLLHLQVEDPVVILGFGPQGQMVANMLSSPLAQAGSKPHAYIGFDLDHSRVTASRMAGFNVAYGNGARSDVLKAAGERGRGWDQGTK
eukprot:GHUV01044841.1.p1 GENE.GHUV01044841.1~~GHUV01044841.1.p1  ORF type:complete len:117 (+),score=21.66 GHUV01044841.1:547-897(+)